MKNKSRQYWQDQKRTKDKLLFRRVRVRCGNTEVSMGVDYSGFGITWGIPEHLGFDEKTTETDKKRGG